MAIEQTSEPSAVTHAEGVHHVFQFDEAVGIDDGMTLHKKGVDGTEGLRVERGGSDPRSASADIDESGTLAIVIVEPASPKEAAELRAAQTLVQYLNASDARWQPATIREGREDGVDCVASGEDGARLEMQITTPERMAWKVTRGGERYERSEAAHEAAAAIRVAIAAKRPKAHRDVLLVLDAGGSPGYALKAVADRFRELYIGEARECGFAAVWLVGPVIETVHRLDE